MERNDFIRALSAPPLIQYGDMGLGRNYRVMCVYSGREIFTRSPTGRVRGITSLIIFIAPEYSNDCHLCTGLI